MPVWDGQKYLMDKPGYSTVIFLSQPNWFLAEFNIGRQRFENLSISKSETFQIWEHVCILLPVLVFWCLQMSTSAGWDGFMEPTLYVDSRGAECNPGLNGGKRTCMSTSFIGYFYFIRYLIATTKWSALIFVKKNRTAATTYKTCCSPCNFYPASLCCKKTFNHSFCVVV